MRSLQKLNNATLYEKLNLIITLLHLLLQFCLNEYAISLTGYGTNV